MTGVDLAHRPDLAVFAAVVLATSTGAATPDERVTFTSGGAKVQAEVFKPSGTGKFPAVVVVYGTRGLALSPPATPSATSPVG
jgi:poly(3-hydroxybutyrate) depolymerase